jgi:predicted nucleic acid-binding protein
MQNMPVTVLDTNTMVEGIQFKFPDYRILKDARHGSTFNYAITNSQVLDFQKSDHLRSKHYFKDLQHYTNMFKLSVLNDSRRFYDPMLRRILKARSDLEESDIRMVECAMQNKAKHIVSRDGHLVWRGLNELIQDYCDSEISVLTPEQFCKAYDHKLVEVGKVEKAVNCCKRGMLSLRGKT